MWKNGKTCERERKKIRSFVTYFFLFFFFFFLRFGFLFVCVCLAFCTFVSRFIAVSLVCCALAMRSFFLPSLCGYKNSIEIDWFSFSQQTIESESRYTRIHMQLIHTHTRYFEYQISAVDDEMENASMMILHNSVSFV